MGGDGSVTYQFVVTLDGVIIIEIDLIEVIGIPMVAFGKFGGYQTCLAVGSDKEEVVIPLFDRHGNDQTFLHNLYTATGALIAGQGS